LIQEEVNGKKFVYLVKTDNGKETAVKSYIEIGESNTKEIIVLSGVNEGDQVISLGAKSITDGDHISIKS